MLRRRAICGCVLFSALACGGIRESTTESNAAHSSGGAEPETVGTGAGSASGGSFAERGGSSKPVTGGAGSVGDPPGNAGAPAAGGESSTGGSLSTGGFVPSGGTTSVGGGGGGVGSSGGVESSGGVPSTGGVESSGGATSTGGVESSGGALGDGGAETTGGAAGAGGPPGVLPKFVGNTTTHQQSTPPDLNFADYWDQITVENAGQWKMVQSSGGAPFNWRTLDAIYDYAETHDIIFKEQALIWGAAQPSGIHSEDDVIRWIRSFCERYPNTALIDVVTEPPPHTEPSFADVIGGGTDGDWQWITNAFIWAREYCPKSVLILNDHSNIERPNDNQHFIDIVNAVLANGGPIDALGAQAHDLDDSSVTAETVSRLLHKLHDDTGLPVYITELDMSYTDDQEQLSAYQEFFPLLREMGFVKGITIWGWIYGSTWSSAPYSGLVRDGVSRPAMTYLMGELGRSAP